MEWSWDCKDKESRTQRNDLQNKISRMELSHPRAALPNILKIVLQTWSVPYYRGLAQSLFQYKGLLFKLFWVQKRWLCAGTVKLTTCSSTPPSLSSSAVIHSHAYKRGKIAYITPVWICAHQIQGADASKWGWTKVKVKADRTKWFKKNIWFRKWSTLCKMWEQN